MSLENVKVGDKLILGKGWSTYITTVERITDTQVICDGARYSKTTGKMIGYAGCGYGAPRISTATEDELAMVRLAARIASAEYRLRRVRVTEENLAAVEILLGAVMAPEANAEIDGKKP